MAEKQWYAPDTEKSTWKQTMACMLSTSHTSESSAARSTTSTIFVASFADRDLENAWPHTSRKSTGRSDTT